jgi:hypothetical protein
MKMYISKIIVSCFLFLGCTASFGQEAVKGNVSEAAASAVSIVTDTCIQATQLAEKDACAAATAHLMTLRGGTADHESVTTKLREKLKQANMSVEDIGTSEDELMKLRGFGERVAEAEQNLRFYIVGEYISFRVWLLQLSVQALQQIKE